MHYSLYNIRNAVAFASFDVSLFAALSCRGDGTPSSDCEIKKTIVEQSIANYPGHCPCPYNLASNGSKCGKRSAWSKAGGYAPMCFPDDVTPAMILQWRQSHQAG
jgi:hypothetical protein